MKSKAPLAVVAALALKSNALALTPDHIDARNVRARAEPANQPHGYAPQTVDCPSDAPAVRAAGSLSDNELSWLPVRRNVTLDPMRDLLRRMNITGLDTDRYISDNQDDPSNLPNIGIACSGGGYRAMMNCAGVVEAFDSRTSNATAPGQLGGLLQSSTYLAGLSGGNWLVGSLYANNFTSIDQILAQDTPDDDSGGLWQLGNSIFEGPESGGIQLLGTASYWDSLHDQVDDKQNAGYNTTITDWWARALSYQLVNASGGGPSYTFSSVANQEFFTNGSVPLPLIVADGRRPGELLVPANTTVFNFDPWEFGSPDPTIYGFAPLMYTGTNFTNGSPEADDQCVVGFDNMGFVMGTSSSLFNQALVQLNTSSLPSFVQDIFHGFLGGISAQDLDIADWVNPFYGWNNDTNPYSSSRRLTLVDGGEDGQNIPLHPLIQPNRHVDVIFAVDSSADTNATLPTNNSAQNWPDGFSLTQTYDRSKANIDNGTVFPSIPDVNTFINLGLNNRPTFFGCNASNLTGPAPLIVYLPNAPYSYNTNFSTFDMSYNDTERDNAILNGFNMATQGNSSLDAQWPACVGCAILSRSMNRTRTAVPDICTQCFERYCWNGTLDSSQPGNYEPALKLGSASALSNAAATSAAPLSLALATAVLASLALLQS